MNINRTVVNIIIDLIATVLFLSMIATGYLLRFTLPPGTNKTHVLWELSRHQWGGIHFWISMGLLLILVVHLALHWNWIVTVIGKRCGLVKSAHPSLLRSSAWTIFFFGVLCIGFAWVAETNVKQINPPGKHRRMGSNQTYSENNKAIVNSTTEPQASSHLVWNDVYPIFQKNCVACHGQDRQLADVRVDQRQDFFKSEAPLVVPGQSDASPLMTIISGTRKNMAMPEKHQLSPADVASVKAWIDQGAQ